jgi:acyl-CoA synthetase (AMP-forming)/AMP-acid ligase II
LVRILKQHALQPTDLTSLRCIEVSAAAMPADLYQQAVSVFGPVFSVLYGLTEAPWSCYRTPPEGADVLAEPEAAHGMVGRATFGCELTISGPQGHLPAGQTGELLIRGAHLMSGYWNQPTLTAEVIRDGWFHTGDLGMMDESGRIYIRGRLKDIIRSGGKSVQPREVEQTLCEHPAVQEAAVVGVADAQWGEAVSAAIVLKPGCSTSADELTAFCREHLSGHKRPKLFIFVDALPRSHYGKVLHGKIREAILSAKNAPSV